MLSFLNQCLLCVFLLKRVYGDSCGALHFFFCRKIKTNWDWEYVFIPEIKTWSEARQFCQDRYDDMAFFLDSYQQEKAVVSQNFPVWIGLFRDGKAAFISMSQDHCGNSWSLLKLHHLFAGLTWKWSAGVSEYTRWEPGKSDGNEGDCVTLSSVKEEMATRNCSDRLPFLCVTDNTVLVKESKTWEEALDHCRAITTPNQPNLRYDLISVQPRVDYEYVMNKVVEATTDEVSSPAALFV